MKRNLDAAVPCNGCTACCRDSAILVSPEHGDDPKLYLTRTETNPLTGQPALFLVHQANGACVYLGAGGCTIHGHAPAICRAYDCRRQYRELLPEMRDKFMRPELQAAARERL